MPVWAFIFLVLVILCAIAAAIVVPLEFFVFHNLGNHTGPKSSLEKCQSSLICQNGGSNVVTQGKCSCICTSGFVGADCSVGGSLGCTTTNLVSSDGSSTIKNVTLGNSIPRLIVDANQNFSIPLSGTDILSKFNSANLSCIAQNSLVTFDGQSTRIGDANAEVVDKGDGGKPRAVADEVAFVSVSVVTILPRRDAGYETAKSATASELVVDTNSMSPTKASSSAGAANSAYATSATSSSQPTQTFTVTEEVVDFARVAVLYVLQEQNPEDAEDAQSDLQDFFTKASKADGATRQDATDLSIGADSKINMVDFTIDLGDGPIGGRNNKRATLGISETGPAGRRRGARRRGSVLAKPERRVHMHYHAIQVSPAAARGRDLCRLRRQWAVKT